MTGFWRGDDGGDEGNRTFYTVEDGDIVIYDEELQPEDPESMPHRMSIGGGFELVMHPDWFRVVMHSPEITAHVDDRCQAMCDMANSLKVEEDAVYIYFVSNNYQNIRARGRVKTGNAKARADNDANATLLKALASVGSDPLPPQYGEWSGSGSVNDDAPDMWVGEPEETAAVGLEPGEGEE